MLKLPVPKRIAVLGGGLVEYWEAISAAWQVGSLWVSALGVVLAWLGGVSPYLLPIVFLAVLVLMVVLADTLTDWGEERAVEDAALPPSMARLGVPDHLPGYESFGFLGTSKAGPGHTLRVCLENSGPATARNVRFRAKMVACPPAYNWGGPYPQTVARSDDDATDIHAGERAYYEVFTVREREDGRGLISMAWETSSGGMLPGGRQPAVLFEYQITADNLVAPVTVYVVLSRTEDGNLRWRITDEDVTPFDLLIEAGYDPDDLSRSGVLLRQSESDTEALQNPASEEGGPGT